MSDRPQNGFTGLNLVEAHVTRNDDGTYRIEAKYEGERDGRVTTTVQTLCPRALIRVEITPLKEKEDA